MPPPLPPPVANTMYHQSPISDCSASMTSVSPLSQNGYAHCPFQQQQPVLIDNADDYRQIPSTFPHFCNAQYQVSPVNNVIFNEISLGIPSNAPIAVKKESESASCHQCKTKKDVSILFYCTHKKKGINNTYSKVIKCRKKYCLSCMGKYFEANKLEKFKKFKDSPSWSFDCPSCQNACSCRACKRKRAKNAKNKLTTAIIL